MNSRDVVRLVREVSGIADVELLEIVPAEVRHGDQILHPARIVRRGDRYLVETVEYPGEWWLGEVGEEPIAVWGSYGSLKEAAIAH